MELIFCLVLAFAAFAGVITCLIGLISAPTPILVTILILGLMLTQKSINKLNEPKVSTGEDRDKEKIEKVEVAVKNLEIGEKRESTNLLKAMNYRGFSYQKKQKLDQHKSSQPKIKTEIKYRGVILSHDKENKAIS